MWLVCHDRLMGNLNRYKRNLTDNPSCFICGQDNESSIHILRDCPAAKSVWRRLGGRSNFSSFYQGDLKTWLSSNLEEDERDEGEGWQSYFGITLWWLWRWRNIRVFENGKDIPVDVGAFLKIRFDETWRSIHGMAAGSFQEPKAVKIEKHISWLKPPDGWYALNTDGAAKGSPGDAGGGAIIRNQDGQFISGFSANYGRCSAFRAEVRALVRGLELARNLQISKLQIQLDNLACVQALNSEAQGSGECAHLINFCHNLLRKDDWEVLVVHVFREGNRAADWLANRGVAQSDNLLILGSAPSELRRILSEDVQGVAFPRFVPP